MRAATKRSVLKFSIVALIAVLAYSLYRCYTHKPQYGGADDEAPEPDAITDKRTFWVVMSVVIIVFLLGVGYMLYSMKKNNSIPKQAPIVPLPDPIRVKPKNNIPTRTVQNRPTVARQTQKPRHNVISSLIDTKKDELKSIEATIKEYKADLQSFNKLPVPARKVTLQKQAHINKNIQEMEKMRSEVIQQLQRLQKRFFR